MMAGGKNAESVVCPICLSERGILIQAKRTYEGDETDEYRCENDHSFGIDWSAGEADEPQWPPSAELRARIELQHNA